MRILKKPGPVAALAFLAVFIIMAGSAMAQVVVNAEVWYSTSQLNAYFYVDTGGENLVSAGFKLTYDVNQLTLISASKDAPGTRPKQWYIGDGINNNVYMDPDTSTPGEVTFVLARLNTNNPTAGVTGARKILGNVRFTRKEHAMPFQPTTFTIGLAYTDPYKNFVNVSGTVLDGANVTFNPQFYPVTGTAPIGSVYSTSAPTFSWPSTPNASWYYLWVNDPNGATILKKWYQAQAGATQSVTPTFTVATTGTYNWWVMPWDSDATTGPWSAAMSFSYTAAAAKPAPIAPIGTIANSSPTYQWTSAGGATWYYLWVNNSSGVAVLKQWFQGVTQATPSLVLPNGSYRWWVQGWNATSGYGPWSNPADFTVITAGGPPGQVVTISPNGVTTSATPTFTWNADPNATWYYLWINNSSGVAVFKQWYQGVTQATLTNPLPPGTYQWWVQGWSPAGYGRWSTVKIFTVP